MLLTRYCFYFTVEWISPDHGMKTLLETEKSFVKICIAYIHLCR